MFTSGIGAVTSRPRLGAEELTEELATVDMFTSRIGAATLGPTEAEEPTEEPATVDMSTSGIGATTSESRREIRSLEEPATVEKYTPRIDDVARSSLKRIAADAASIQVSAVGTY